MRCPKCGADMELKGYTCVNHEHRALYWCPTCKNVELG